MPLLLQHLLVIVVAAGCAGIVLWQAVQTLIRRKGRMGSCCAKGCEPPPATDAKSEKIIFVPAETLGRRK